MGDLTKQGNEQSAMVTESGENRDLGFKNNRQVSSPFARLIGDHIFRRKLVRTGILCWSLVGSGFIMGMSGPAFLDITAIINEDITKATFMFTIANFGYLAGSLGGGILFDRWNKLALLIVQTLGLAISHCLTPYCTSLTPLLVARFFVGLFAGAVETGTQADIFYIWGSGGSPYMLALHFTYSVGSLIAPLVTEPFLAERTPDCLHLNSSNDVVNSSTEIRYNDSNIAMLENCGGTIESTQVHFAFIIAASVCLSSTVCLIVLYFSTKMQFLDERPIIDKKISSYGVEKEVGEISKPRPGNGLSMKLKMFLLAFACLQLSSCAIVEDNFGSFLMTFTTVQLQWRKSEGSLATAVSRIALTVARFVTIFMTKCCKNSVLLLLLLVALMFGCLGFYLAVLYSYTHAIWIFTAVIGAAVSSLYPTVINWTTENIIDVKGWVLSILVTVVCVFSLIFPSLFGYLIDQVDPMWFIYLLIIVQSFSLLNYGFLIILRRCFSRQVDKNAGERDGEVKTVFIDQNVEISSSSYV